MDIKYIVSVSISEGTKHFEPAPNKIHIFGSRECADNWIRMKIEEIFRYLQGHREYGKTLTLAAYGDYSVSWKELDKNGTWQTPRIRYFLQEAKVEMHC